MKICAVQLNPKSCRDFNEFYSYLFEIFEQAKDSDLIVFPENINFCLLNYKSRPLTLSTKTFIEELFDSFISKINLSFILKKQNLDLQKDVILATFILLADKFKINVITGSFYEKKDDGVYNSIYAIDRNGHVIESQSKKDLVGLEKAFRVKSNNVPKVANFDFGKVGLCICFDLNDPEYCSKFKCDILVAPSNGYRPFPGYPFDFEKETPQIQRAEENNYAVVRPYFAGWMFPLYFQGRTMIVDKFGTIYSSKTRNKTELVFATIIA
jgi:predicted amidohydrolase